MNTTRNDNAGVEIYKNLCRQSWRAGFASSGHPYLCECEISDVLKASATSQSLANVSSTIMMRVTRRAIPKPWSGTTPTHLIPLSPVRLSSTAKAPKPIEAHTTYQIHQPSAATPNATPPLTQLPGVFSPHHPKRSPTEATNPEIHHHPKRKAPRRCPKGI